VPTTFDAPQAASYYFKPLIFIKERGLAPF
jgi:hypothetical protein